MLKAKIDELNQEILEREEAIKNFKEEIVTLRRKVRSLESLDKKVNRIVDEQPTTIINEEVK
jgi:uncharacterized coiled-coil DUF342 family protein